MRRALDTILDRPPASDAQIWAYFGSECAYCGRNLDKGNRFGDIDHAIAGGGNHLGNLVLACPSCNGDEKREMSWITFLDLKVSDRRLREARRKKIWDWMEKHPAPLKVAKASAVEAKTAEIRQLIDDFGNQCVELRGLLRQSGDEDAG